MYLKIYIFKDRYFFDSKRVIESYLITRAPHKSLLQLHPKPAASKHRYLRAPGEKKLSAIICQKRKQKEREKRLYAHNEHKRIDPINSLDSRNKIHDQPLDPSNFSFSMDQPINLGPQLHSSETEIRGCVPLAQDKFHNNTKRRSRSCDGTIYRPHSRPPRCENCRDFAWRISIRYRRGDHRRSSRRLALISTPSYVYRINHDTRVQTLLQIAREKRRGRGRGRERRRRRRKKIRGEVSSDDLFGNEDRVPFDNYGPGGPSRGIGRKISSNYNIHLHPVLN